MIGPGESSTALEEIRTRYPDKCVPEAKVFSRIHRGDRIFIGTGCGEPQYLLSAFTDYARSHPKSFFDAEVFHVWTLGVTPYTDEKLQHYFRHNSFFIGATTRDQINRGAADYTPMFMSQAPELFYRKLVPVDVAMVQASPPDEVGVMSLGVSVDITKAAVESASVVMVQVNSHMPRVHGDTHLHVDEVDFIIPHDEPLLEYRPRLSGDIARRIGDYVARIVEDGDTIQVGYGSIPNAVLANLRGKKHLGVHTELLSDGIVELMKAGVIDNSRKSVDRGRAVASFCMGSRETYEYIHDNPLVEFRSIDRTNNPLKIARHDHMVAINGGLQIDLTGQATAESIGSRFYSGIGGQTDFMRGTVLCRHGKTILTIPSTAQGGTVSRIVPFLEEGAGVTLNRGDVHYVVTEYGIAYLHGKNIRERAMELISIAHPYFRPRLIEEAKRRNLIYGDQTFIPGKAGEYPEELESYRTTRGGVEILLRPIKISDEPKLKEFVYSLSDQTLYRRFFSRRMEMPHSFLQKLVVIDYTETMAILAVVTRHTKEEIVGVGRYFVDTNTHRAEVAFAVQDEYQNKGIGRELLSYLILLAKKQGLLGFTAEVLAENAPMIHLFRSFEEKEYEMEKKIDSGTFHFDFVFKEIKAGA